MSLRLKSISIGLFLLLLVAGSSDAAEILQATAEEHGLYAAHIGDQLMVGRVGSESATIDVPRGTDLYSLQPTSTGWVAGGHIPTGSSHPDLLLIRQNDGQVEMLPLPDRGPGKQRGQPVLLVGGGSLRGIAWIEGNQQSDLQVWAATWNGNDWGEPESVSGPGPGSQLALTGAVLGDQSWLLVWTGFDGTDDETVFSRRIGGIWSAVARVHEDNEVPDITPTLLALDQGALAAWSWFDGSDYRLRTAHFDGQEWLVSEAIGEKGSLEPSFVPAGEGAQLLFHTVVPETWTVVEIDSTGMLSRTASVPRRDPRRPLLLDPIAHEVRLAWPAATGKIDNSTLRSARWEPVQ